MRELTMTLEADTNPVADTNVVLMNADKQITGTLVQRIRTVRLVESIPNHPYRKSGTTNDDLAGYEAVTVAKKCILNWQYRLVTSVTHSKASDLNDASW